MRIGPTPQQLEVFLRVAAAGSFSGAARVLAVSQPALSRTIKVLEDQIGARLFDRDSRTVTLTPTGAALLPIAERMIREFTGEFAELARFVAGRRGRVAIAALPSVSAALLPAALRRFAAAFPEVEIVILDGLSQSVVDAVTNGQADFGLTAQPPPGQGFAYAPLLSDEFGLVCQSDDAMAAGTTSLTWSVFTDRPFVAMAASSSVRAMTDAAFLQAGLTIPARYECAFLGTAGALVAAGLGLTALPRLAMPLTASGALHWRPLREPVLRRPIGLVTHMSRTLAPAALAFIDILRRTVAEVSAGSGQMGVP